MPRADVQAALDECKHVEGKRFSDKECYEKLVHIIYYAGFTANTVIQKIPTINKWFPHFTVHRRQPLPGISAPTTHDAA